MHQHAAKAPTCSKTPKRVNKSNAHTVIARLSCLSAHAANSQRCVFVRQPHVHTSIHTRTLQDARRRRKKKNTTHAHLDRLKINGGMGWALSCLHSASSCLGCSACLSEDIAVHRHSQRETHSPF